MTRGRDPRPEMDVLPHIAFLGQVRLAGVQTHPHPDRSTCERRLRRRRGRHCPTRIRKHDEERIPLRIDLHAAMHPERLTQHTPMLRQRIRIRLFAELVQQLGRPLHVGEKEGDSPGGKRLRHDPMMVERPRRSNEGRNETRTRELRSDGGSPCAEQWA